MIKNEALTLYAPTTDMVAVRLDEASYPRIGKCSPEQAAAVLLPMVGGACIIRGAVMTDDGRRMTAEALADILREKYPDITIVEIGKAIKQGCYGEYGEVYGINAASLFRMVAGYEASEEKADLRLKVRKVREQKLETAARLNAEWLAQHPNYTRTTL